MSITTKHQRSFSSQKEHLVNQQVIPLRIFYLEIFQAYREVAKQYNGFPYIHLDSPLVCFYSVSSLSLFLIPLNCSILSDNHK